MLDDVVWFIAGWILCVDVTYYSHEIIYIPHVPWLIFMGCALSIIYLKYCPLDKKRTTFSSPKATMLTEAPSAKRQCVSPPGGKDESKSSVSSKDVLAYVDSSVKPGVNYPRILYYLPEGEDPVNARLLPFDPNNVVYSEPKAMQFGGHTVFCSYHLVDPKLGVDCIIPVTLQSPIMRCPWGANENTKEGQRKQTSIDLSFFGMENNPEVMDFYNVMKLWGEIDVEKAKQNKTSWFQGAHDVHENVIQHFYKAVTRPRVRASDKKVFSPSITLKAMKRYNVYEAEVYNSDSVPKQIEMKNITPGTSLECLFTHTGLWFNNNSFSPSFKLMQAQVQNNDCVVGFSMVSRK